jgi:sulfite exporter TauE/SafE
MTVSLLLASASLALVGGFHCTAMCAGLIRPLTHSLAERLVFVVARICSYAVLGGVVGAGSEVFTHIASGPGVLRSVWWMLQLSVVLSAMWMVLSGRTMADILGNRFGLILLSNQPAASVGNATPSVSKPIHFYSGQRSSLIRSALAGAAWAALPCGLLYSAAMLAWVSGSMLSGAALMAVFAVVSSLFLNVSFFVGRIARSFGLNYSEQFGNRFAGAAVLLASAGLLLQHTGHADAAAWLCF